MPYCVHVCRQILLVLFLCVSELALLHLMGHHSGSSHTQHSDFSGAVLGSVHLLVHFWRIHCTSASDTWLVDMVSQCALMFCCSNVHVGAYICHCLVSERQNGEVGGWLFGSVNLQQVCFVILHGTLRCNTMMLMHVFVATGDK